MGHRLSSPSSAASTPAPTNEGRRPYNTGRRWNPSEPKTQVKPIGAHRLWSPAHPMNKRFQGYDDVHRPKKFDFILRTPGPDRATQEKHSWNPDDTSTNIYVKEEDRLTLHRLPVAQSTDCIRGRIGYTCGFHVWELTWPVRQRGTHAVVGVATKRATLQALGYTSLIGSDRESYGWDIIRNKCCHDSKNTPSWAFPLIRDCHLADDSFMVPDKFYCILDMDEGYMAFATEDRYLGVAFRGLKGKQLYPIVSSVWGHCEITMRYLGGLDPEATSLKDICRRAIRTELGREGLRHVHRMGLPPKLSRYVLYQ
ncbi:hypothetical protein L596_009218 [Steinernema carpocapsae]|uniref:B30.2/SPRY domain-containing protein n=1 Tax=Steinernema carpocapsae TaxID=34508 RepID=A0A4U5PF89_STECR|nr:hypothetical protein L596_009218 [Steinernema carpocapsae]